MDYNLICKRHTPLPNIRVTGMENNGKKSSDFYIRGINANIILNSINDGVIVIGLDRKIKFANRAALETMGYTQEEIKEFERCRDFMKGECCQGKCLLERTLETGEGVSNYETVIKNRRGIEIPVSVNTALVRDETGKVVGSVEVFRDLSLVKELSGKLQEKFSFGNIVGKNYKMKEIYDILPAVAATKATVLIEGESGTGKELIAQAIHENSPRRDKPFIKVNCAALAEGVLESELFGHVKGAFTGAIHDKPGRFELAHRGTIFLDEIGEIPPSTQVKLLRVLQEEEFERVGGTQRIKVDVRVIAATNKDLAKAVNKGEFRKDLYYRLRVVPIYLPPLRERKDDIPLLISHFLEKFRKEMGKNINNISPRAMEILMDYNYPGNIRELENIIEHAFVLCQGNTILPEHLPKDIQRRDFDIVERVIDESDPLKALERELLLRVLEQTNWRLKDACARLKMSRTTLWRRIKELGIKRD